MLERKSLYSDAEAGSLRRVYILALNALRQTHIVTETIEHNLAHAVFDAYLALNCPVLPLPDGLVEELAIASIEMMVETYGMPIFRTRS